MRSLLLLVTPLALAGTVLAAPKVDLAKFAEAYLSDLAMVGTTNAERGVAKLGFTERGVRIDQPFDEASYADAHYELRNTVIAWAADKSAAWVSSDLAEIAGGMGGTTPGVVAWAHGAAVIQPTKTGWHGVAYLTRETVDDREQAKILADGVRPPALQKAIGKGAEPVVKLLTSTMSDPKAFAATVSEREDTVLFGSSTNDRIAGGKAAAAALLKWNLKLTIRDGVRAGLVGTTVAWAAANVDAVKVGEPKTSAVPYQMLVILEKSSADWRIVQLSFAFQAHAPE